MSIAHSGLPAKKPSGFQMGRIAQMNQSFTFTEEMAAVHMCVLGQSGSGKSKFLELLMRYLMVGGRGFAIIDPHGDLSEDLLAFATYRAERKGDESLLNRLHYLEPSYEQVFHYDPFKFNPRKPIPPEKLKDAIRSWLHTKADRIGEIVQRKQGDSSFAGMARLQRVLTNLLTAVGTQIDEKGKHLPLSDALVLLDPSHPRHNDVFVKVAPFLFQDIREEFERFREYIRTKNPRRFLDEAESTMNRLRSILSPLMKAIFADHVETIDFYSIIQNSGVLLVNLRETDYFSADQASAIGGLFIHELLTTAQNTPRELRRNFYTIIDEAGDFIGADIQRALGIMRKFEMPLCLAAQDLSSFVKGDLDLRPKVLSQCGSLVSFRQTWPDDLDILARVMGTGNLDFSELLLETDRDDGYDFLPMKEFSQSFSWQDSWNQSLGQSFTHTTGTQSTRTVSQQDAFSEAHNKQSNRGTTDQFGKELFPQSYSLSQSKADGTTSGRVSTSGDSSSDGESKSNSVGMTKGKGTGGSDGGGVTVSHKNMPLSRKRVELQRTGKLLHSVSDQFEKMKQDLHGLGQGEAVAKLRGIPKAFAFQTHFVNEKWSSEDKFAAIERMKKHLVETRGYFTPANLSAAAETERIDQFVSSPVETAPIPEQKKSPFPD
jgi:hypothetical protein